MSLNQNDQILDASLHRAGSKADEHAIQPVDSVRSGDIESLRDEEKKATTIDPVFGEIKDGGPNYRNVGWIQAAFLMIKSQVGIGVLSVPKALAVLGLLPGIITLFAVAIITTWSDYMVGCFKLRHPEVYGIDDAGAIMFGQVGKIVLRVVFFLYWVFVAASAIMSTSIGLNAISEHATCTQVFVAVAAVVAWILTSIPTLSKLSWLAALGALSIMVSILTVTIGVGVQDRPAAAPQVGPFTPDFKIMGEPTFPELISAVSMIIFAFSGTPAFFPIMAEMKNPKHYFRSMFICQATVCTIYLVIGVVVYYYCGSYVTSPALGSAGPLMKKVCYSIAFPGLLVTGMIVSHFPAKMLLVRLLKGSKHLAANTPTHWTVWLSCTFIVVILAYIIASAVPSFDSLIALVGALLGTAICLQPMGCMWLHDNYKAEKKDRDWRWRFMVGWSVFVVLVGFFCMIAGTYGAAVGLMKAYSGDGGGSPWSCADNSDSS